MLTPAEFRELHRPGEPFVLPNAWDLASARWLHADGHPVVGTTSLGVAFAAGRADGTGETADETIDLARRITGAGIAVTVDIEAGFSDEPDEVGRYAAELAGLGVVGVNLEDSDAAGRLVDPEAAARKIAAVAAAAPALYLNARTDPFWIGGEGDRAERTREALARSHRYLAAGATGVFVPGAIPLDTIAALARDIPAPVNVLVQSGVPVRDLAEVGVARISTGSLLFRVALGAISAAARRVGDGSYVPEPGTPSYDEVAGLP
ncbi:isocitrate lyase/PEP mutase family protein [Agromyces mariniharenae]|uniref:Isocitrate lyase/phosphoenolpyruvate mutase family protein n=1 Tax=Agromyces mariniharenae TaxID=2604423 RepID=A0A5S4UZH2_9MICO|nr:isocitrate lyase/phosphoenolpyruvate mutase family protein [Agromyces mariniharenae]TYL51119.1 isocitrate lyase/phosphoenolpyruvate mutase family protein [Agromyces mariniharenae]